MKSPEPDGDPAQPLTSRATSPRALRFVVQRHRARHEHFDLRLELDGVLLSWAVTKGPSADPGTRRLAVRTEDHPLAYANFEGTIPDQSYGAGPVMIWDHGTWASVGAQPARALAEGHLKFVLTGDRMRGRWALVRLKEGGRGENWLLVKDRDAFAEQDDSLARRFDKSVTSGRTFTGILKSEQGAPEKLALPPHFIAPMLCATARVPPLGPDWLFEMKYDGYRLQLSIGVGTVVLRTRSGLDWTDRFPEILNSAKKLPVINTVMDGEAVVLGQDGLSDYPKLVAAIGQGGAGIQFVAFDLLRLNDADLTKTPLIGRRTELKRIIGQYGRQNGVDASAIRVASAITAGGGDDLLFRVAAAGGEGIVAKRMSSRYYSRRSLSWLKIKAVMREDAVVIGMVPSPAGRHFSSLLLAFREPDGLRYVGRVGAGFTAREELNAFHRLMAHARKTPPHGVVGIAAAPANAKWVTPCFTAAIAFGGWTGDRRLRAARFLGWRDDIAPPKSNSTGGQQLVDPMEAKPVTLTHAARVVFPDRHLTKADVAAYYQRVAPRMLPHLELRPVSLLRAPDGVGGEMFFQRHPMPSMRRGIVRIPAADHRGGDYFSISDAQGLATAVQFGAIEFHGWGARSPDLDAPDRMIFDLDPAVDVPFCAVRSAAQVIRKVLTSAGLKNFPLITGGKGIHVVVPLDGSQGWPDIETFARTLALTLARAEPDRYVATASKARRKGRIYIDWLRNKRSATAIVPYSLRARADASIATPVTWAAVPGVQDAAHFTAVCQSTATDAPWRSFFSVRQHISAAILETLRRFG